MQISILITVVISIYTDNVYTITRRKERRKMSEKINEGKLTVPLHKANFRAEWLTDEEGGDDRRE